MRYRGVGLVLGLTLAIAATAAAPAASEPQTAAGSLDVRMTLAVVSDSILCPPGVPQDGTDCRARTGQSVVAGLGRVSETYTWLFRVGPPTCPANLAKPLATTGRFVVAGKGEIVFSLSDGLNCVDVEPVRFEPQEFTITGGTGSFVGASGSGKVEPTVSGGAGTETWTGTFIVPGLEFDVTPPTLVGAKSKTVRAAKGAKRARVTFKVTAVDGVDGAVPATCTPRSGSRFKIGRRTVRCNASDSSGNSAKAAFTVTVKPRR
jgi:HYR domain